MASNNAGAETLAVAKAQAKLARFCLLNFSTCSLAACSADWKSAEWAWPAFAYAQT